MAFEKPTDEALENIFMHHNPADHQIPLYGAIRRAALRFAKTVRDLVPLSPYATRANNKIQEAMMLANSGIALTPPEATSTIETHRALQRILSTEFEVELRELRSERAAFFVLLEPFRKTLELLHKEAQEEGRALDDRDCVQWVQYATLEDKTLMEGVLTAGHLRALCAPINAQQGILNQADLATLDAALSLTTGKPVHNPASGAAQPNVTFTHHNPAAHDEPEAAAITLAAERAISSLVDGLTAQESVVATPLTDTDTILVNVGDLRAVRLFLINRRNA